MAGGMDANEEGSGSSSGSAPRPLGRKVPGYGPAPCDLMLIAEAPGIAEEKSSRPLVGKTGRETARYMSQARLVRLRGDYDYLGEHVYLTNVVKYRPFTRTLTGNNPPSPEEIRRDEPELIEEIRRVQPKFIGAVGAVAARWLIGAQYGGMDENYGLPYRLSSKRAKQIGADALPHRPWVIPLIHPAAGMHSPGTQPHIYDGFMRLGQYVRGELPLTVPVDPFDDPDYYEVRGSSVSLIRNRPVYIDTEGLLGSVWGLSFTQHAGSAGVIRVENKRAVRSIRDQLRGMTVVMHHAIHDVPILSEMFGMTIAQFLAHIKGFEDTMVKAYVLRMPPLALKPSCRRYLGMSMETYLDIVYDADRKIAVDYLKQLLRMNICTKCGGAGEYVDHGRVSAKTGKALTPMVVTCGECEGDGTSLPDPEVTIEYVDGKPMLRRGHRIGKRVRGILKDMRIKPAETDPRDRWEGVDYQYRIKVEDVAGVMRPVSLNDVEPQERAIQYSGRDSDSTLRYDAVLEEMIDADPKSDRLRRVYAINRDSMPMLMRMREVGTLIDIPFFGALTKDLTKRQNTILHKLAKVAGRYINPSSSKQVAELLFDDMGLPPVALTKGGDDSTADKVLEDLKLQVAAWGPNRKQEQTQTLTTLTYITDYREFSKMKGTYTEKLPRVADRNGRIHTTFRATTTEGNRTSSADPNLFNIPNPDRSEVGKQVRCGFVAPPGYVLLEADMSQIEMRVLAHESKDKRLCAAIRSGADIHTNTAMMIFHVAKDHVEKWMRTASKCFHPDTEVLTLSGWKRIVDLGFGEEIAQAIPSRNYEVRLEWVKPLEVYSQKHPSGALVHLKNQGMDLRVTPDHRMLGWTAHGYPTVVTPDKLNNGVRGWANAGMLPGELKVNEDLLRLAVAVQADGSITVDSAVTFGFSKQHKIDRLTSLLGRVGIPAAKSTKNAVTSFYVRKLDSIAILSLLDHKSFPWWWLQLTPELRTAVLDEVQYWDSHRVENRTWYSNTDKQSVDVLQAVAAVTNRKTRLRTSLPRGKEVKTSHHLTVRDSKYTRSESLEARVYSYTEDVACLSVPSSYVLVRDGEAKIPVIVGQTLGFGIVYGISAPALKAQIKLRTGLDVAVEDAQGYIDAYLSDAYPGIGDFMLDCYAAARRYGYSEDMFGWRRYLPGVHSAIASVKAEAERIAVNNIVQAGASGIVKLSAPVIMGEVLPYVRKKGWDCDPLLTVYDSYLFQVRIGGEKLLGELVRKAMIEQIKLRVPLDVDVHWGRSWGGIKEAT